MINQIMKTLIRKIKSVAGFKNVYVREFLAEALGTFMLVVVGNANVAQFNFQTSFATYVGVALGWGLGVAAAVLISGGVSGGHVNPAVTLAMACFGKLPWKKVAVYMLAQYLGGFLAAAVVYGTYISSFDIWDPDREDTGLAGIWATQPGPGVSLGNAFADQVVGTAILLIVVCAITDTKNMNVSKGLIALYVGLTVTMIGLSFGYNAGFAINPARDLSPRILSFIVGYDKVFGSATWDYVYWWIPVVGPHVGGILGVALYFFFIELHWPDAEEETVERLEEVAGTSGQEK